MTTPTKDMLLALLVFPSKPTRQRWAHRYGWAAGDPYPEDVDGRVVAPGYPRCRVCGEGLEWYRRSDALEHADCRNKRRCAEGRLRRAMRSTVSVLASGPDA